MGSVERATRWNKANTERRKEISRAHYLRHKEKILAQTKARRAESPEKFVLYQKAYRLKNADEVRLKGRARRRDKMGCPEPTRPEPSRCECCDRLYGKAMRLDHDHETGLFRGWLCNRCNLAIGLLGDTLQGTQNAVSYLLKHYS